MYQRIKLTQNKSIHKLITKIVPVYIIAKLQSTEELYMHAHTDARTDTSGHFNLL